MLLPAFSRSRKLFQTSKHIFIYFAIQLIIAIGVSMSIKSKILLIVLSVYLIIQFIPVDRTNPETDPALKIAAPPEVMSILQRSCFDCHSNETVWPAYAHLAPFSWFVVDDVNEGRRHLNFSEWNTYPDKRKNRKAEEIWEEIKDGEMPLSQYSIMHGDAELSADDKLLIKSWTDSLVTRPGNTDE